MTGSAYGVASAVTRPVQPQTMTVNAPSRAVMERIGMAYVRTFPTSETEPAEIVAQGEVEYELTREQWEAR